MMSSSTPQRPSNWKHAVQQQGGLLPPYDRMSAAPPRCRTAGSSLGGLAQEDEECTDPFDGCSMLGVRSCPQPAALASVPSSATTLALGTVDVFEPKKTGPPVPGWDAYVTAATPSSAYPPRSLQGGARAGGIYSAAASGSGPCASLTLYRTDGISG